MALESINHYLSSRAVVDYPSMYEVNSRSPQESQTPVVTPLWPQARRDTSAKAELPFFILTSRRTSLSSRLSVAEMGAIEARIRSESKRVDYLHELPGLLKV